MNIMKKLLSAIIILSMVIGINSCKKYPDGPLLSLRSKTARMVNEWVIDKVMSKGVDVTDQYPKDYLLSLKKDDTYSKTDNAIVSDGKWVFLDKKSQLQLTETKSGTQYVFTILRLKNKELTLEQVVNTETITFYMVVKP
ncbi:MAG: hypothetical protein AUJ98_10335 [Bacteroidetes bacterium CG2_30_33_31]|nr:MAG: hypothetical protein AUJ98_10335 [Bacteroidetes bacterium CG2_30_33_31]